MNSDSWTPKAAGFESGNSGNTSYGKARIFSKRMVPDRWQYKLGLLMDLEEKGIKYEEKADGTIVADMPDIGLVQMTPELRERNYRRHINQMVGREMYIIA